MFNMNWLNLFWDQWKTLHHISLLTKHCFINFVLNFHNQSPSNKFGNFVRAQIVTPGQHYSSLQNMIRVVFKQSSIALFPPSILLCNLKVCNLNRVSNQALKLYETKSWQIMLSSSKSIICFLIILMLKKKKASLLMLKKKTTSFICHHWFHWVSVLLSFI